MNSTPGVSTQRKCQRRKKVETSYSQSQMDQSKPLGWNSVWEHPLESWIVRNETKNKKFFKEKSDEWHTPTPHQDDSTQDDKEAKVTSGFYKRILFIVIMWNPESNCTRREKNHLSFRWSTSTLSERHTHLWMYCWRKILKIFWTWMEKKNYLMHGQASQDSSYWTNDHLMDTHGPVRDLRRNKQSQ